ncbi:structural maintenance of chromosome 2, putative [Trypanosoma brucei gambiense DAL972]|uniref:Structural maintenance of chromosomes protein n=2 Tax=Trypanosoma brucei TaxID=5691 RepID=D0A4G9_TRYB9|nr:structural maintenance of chromosome 2, putative [Trypanosoma brucei gambiense DAL972]RHW68560.1 structural maintenance of chromosome 2 [Trypanosoma brucei equiperdum]CBH16163.1 structural maintenance of chromosome 2, putative [Trypanosoma brucei gambiense DAL972]|eukprot:XP_011778427.1 structural maintenance of chromosome 2, putative [Trypanosoma brucei gambiense DAL972]
MRVKSIVIDGFKSYAHRKVIDDLSPHFNAITGLNGSGKSNIFDAICFVMGITNLKRVRAEDPRELIFRAGTTGVHAARVTIEFINDDPRTAPPGYSCEEYPTITVGRQIKLGGKQQFFLNNTVSVQSKVKRFFESISLNVDNPHFMVLQGTVHKLIGMRSEDILSLIEEAVGTKAFDHRRRTAESLIRSKEKKMEEIDANLETQIGPMLRAMKADQEEYERYVQLSEGIEEMRKFRIAFEYEEHRKRRGELSTRRTSLLSDTAAAKEQLRSFPSVEDETTQRLMQLQSTLAAPAEAAMALHEEESTLKLQLAREEAQLERLDKVLKKLADASRKLEEEKQQQKSRAQQFEAYQEQREKLIRNIHEQKENIAKLKRSLQLNGSGVRAGASGMSLEEERADIERQVIKSSAEARRREERIRELEHQQKSVAEKSEARERTVIRLRNELRSAQDCLDSVSKRYINVKPLEEQARALQEEVARLKAEHWKANDAMLRESAQGGGSGGRGLDLEYDRRACAGIEQYIWGRVVELVSPQEEKYAIALTVGAQSQLMRVVVTSDIVAERIIRHGLRQRTAFLPLNTLTQPKSISDSQLEEAKRMANRMNGFVAVAKDLTVVKDEAHRVIADYVFGNFFICSTLELAQELAYGSAVRCKAVTLDGEVVEPKGLMTGGSKKHIRNVFADVLIYKKRKAPVEALRVTMEKREKELEGLHAQLREHRSLIQEHAKAEEAVSIATHKLQLVENEEEGLSKELQASLKEERQKYEALTTMLNDLQERRARLEKYANLDSDKVRKDLQEQLSAAQKRCAALVHEEESGSAEFERVEAEMTQTAADIEQKLVEVHEQIHQQTKARDEASKSFESTSKSLQEVVDKRCRAEEQRQNIEKEIEETQQELQQLVVKKASLEGFVKNAEVDVREISKSLEELQKLISEAERRNTWIEEKQHLFGPRDGPFYFEDRERTQETLAELREAEVNASTMSKRLNKKALILYEERKKEYDELVQQRSVLGEDRDAIQQCILGIEDKKWRALDRMVEVVSNVFSKLFSTCLPGAAAVLREERNEHGHLSGLQVKVLFNGKERESLSELSGGQRSLLALCLILAILRVRQAPMYILDEVDAALDPSHTQGIGNMLQKHFPSSQFLLVSLKDGMFSNADVLYQVSNTQGYSEITRIQSNRSR